MAKLNRYSIIFNGAGALIALVVVGYVVKDLFSKDETPVCTIRYPAPTQFSLETHNGAPMSSIELQARAGARERGMLENAKTVRDGNAPAATLLEVELAQPQSGGRARSSDTTGIVMSWNPPDLDGASSACLSYSLWLPEDFPFGNAGTLPGIVGEPLDAVATGGKRTGFAARLMWRDGGSGELLVQLPSSASPNGISVDRGKFGLQRGRWVAIEQEMVVNTPGKPDGLLRLWIDGALKSEHKTVQWREDETTLITSVVADIGYGSLERRAAAPRDTTIRFTPFELRWQ